MRLVEAVRSTGSQLERAVDPTVGHHRAPAQKGERSRMFHKSGTGARGGAGPALSVLGRPPPVTAAGRAGVACAAALSSER